MLIAAATQAAGTDGCGYTAMLVGADDGTLQSFCSATGFEPARARFVRLLRKRALD